MKFESRKDAPLGKARAEKITFSMETVKCLTEAVENSGDPNLQLRLSKLYKKMDTVAAISNKTLLDVVTETIDITKDMKYHRQKNRLMLTQKVRVKLVKEFSHKNIKESLKIVQIFGQAE